MQSNNPIVLISKSMPEMNKREHIEVKEVSTIKSYFTLDSMIITYNSNNAVCDFVDRKVTKLFLMQVPHISQMTTTLD